MDDEHVIYRSYLLRIWYTGATDSSAWLQSTCATGEAAAAVIETPLAV